MSLRGQETRRRMSGFLASVLVFVFVFEQFFMSLSYAGVSGNVASPSDAVRGGRVSYQSSEAGPVQIAVMSDEAIYESGDDVCLDLYIKNNTDQEISDGKLTFKTKGIEEGSGYFEDMGAVYEDVLAEMIAAEGGDGNTSFKVKYDNGNDDEDMEDLGEEDAVKLTGLDMEPGEIHHVLFHFTVKDEEVSKSQKIRFNFEGKVESGRVRAQTTFHYAAGAMNLLPVQIGEKGKLEAGEAGSMLLDFELGNIEDIILEKEAENEDSALPEGKNANSTDSNAGKASASNAWIKWEDETTTSKRKEEQPVIKGLECSVNISGVKLNNFKVEKKGDDDYGTSTVCTFNVEENAQPGVYYGEVTAKYRVGSKNFTSTQGFSVVVEGEEVLDIDDEAVLEVIRMIRELPGLEETWEKHEALDDAGDDDAYFEFIMDLYEQMLPIYVKYYELTEEQRAQIPEEEQMIFMAYSSLLEVMTMADYSVVIMYDYPRGNGWNGAYKDAFSISQTLNFANGWKRNPNNTNPKFDFHAMAQGGAWKNNQIAYCIEPGIPRKGDNDNGTYTTDFGSEANKIIGDETKSALIGRIISSDFAYKEALPIETDWTPTDSDMQRTIATQLLVWEVVVGERDENFTHITESGKAEIKNIINSGTKNPKARELVEAIDIYYGQIEADVKNRSKKPDFGNEAHNFSWNATKNRYEVILTDKNNVLKDFTVKVDGKALNNSIRINNIDFKCERSNNNNTLTISTSICPTNAMTFSVEATKTTDRAGYVVWSDKNYGANVSNNKQDVVTYNGSPVEDELKTAVNVSIGAAKNDAKVTIKKVDENGQPVTIANNAKFTLLKNDASFRDNIQVGFNGQVEITGLGTGNYTLTEKEAPQGYQKSGETYKFKVVVGSDGNLEVRDLTSNNILSEISVENVQFKTNVTLRKTDNNNNALAGATFTLTGNGRNDTIVIPESGEYTISNLTAGTYNLTETDAPDGYKRLTAPVQFVVAPNANNTALVTTSANLLEGKIVIRNEQLKINVNLRKTNSHGNTSQLVNGATFKLTKDGTVVNDKITVSNGTYTIPNLTIGNYVLEETTVPSGYNKKGDGRVSFTVRSNANDTALEIVNVSGSGAELLSGNTIEVVNEETAKLEITKRVDYNKTTSDSPSKTDTFTVQVQLGSVTDEVLMQNANSSLVYTANYSKNGYYQFVLKDGEKATIEGIPVGTSYTITEPTMPGDYKLDVTESGSLNSKIVGRTNSADGIKTNSVTVVNHYYKPQLVNIDASKTWVDEDGETIFNGSNMAVAGDLKPVSVTVQLQRTVKGTANWTDVEGKTEEFSGDKWSCNFNELPKYENEQSTQPYVYRVKETDITYGDSSEYEAEQIAGTNIFKIQKNQPYGETGPKEMIGIFQFSSEERESGLCVIQNKWIPAASTGPLSFDIQKTDEDGNVIVDAALFELYKDEDCTEEAVYEKVTDKDETGNDGITRFKFDYKDLEEGTYYLREEKAPAGYHKLDELLKVEISKKELAVTSNDDNTSWTNKWTWTAKIGDHNLLEEIYKVNNKRIKIKMTKSLDFNDLPEGAVTGYEDKKYTFEIYKGTDIYGADGITVREGLEPVDTLIVTADGTTVVETNVDLLLGETYTIVEKPEIPEEGSLEADNYKIPNYTWKGVDFTGKDDASTEPGFQVKIEDDTVIINIAATNHYTRNLADLEVTKQVDWNDVTSYAPNPDQEFEIKVQLGDSEEVVWTEKTDETAEGAEVREAVIGTSNEASYVGDGVYIFSIKGREKATIKDVPVDTKYTVIESQVMLDGSTKADSRYTFDGIKLANTADDQQTENSTIPEGTTPEGTESEETNLPSESEGQISLAVLAEGESEGQETGEDGNETELPNPDETDTEVPGEDVSEEEGPISQTFTSTIEDHGPEKWTEEVIVINHFYDVKMIEIKSDKSWKTSSGLDLADISSLNDLLPESIDIVLKRKLGENGEEDPDFEVPAQLTSADNWEHTFAKQPQYPAEDSEIAYVYYVVEEKINYTTDDPEQTGSEYTAIPIVGTNIFKVIRQEADNENGLQEVIGVFEVAYEEDIPGVEDEAGSIAKLIPIKNVWKSAARVDRGEAGFDITKIGNVDSTPLAGAVFALKPEGTVNGVTRYMVSDDNGHLAFGNLPVGQYTMTEYRAPEGYQKLDTQWTINVTKVLNAVTPNENDQTIWTNEWLWSTEIVGNEGTQLTVGNDKIQGSISIAKTLTLNGQPDTNMTYRNNAFTFAIYEGTDLTRTPAATMTIRPNGEEEVTGELNYGIYTIVEVSRIDADGYTWENVEFVGEDADTDAPGFQVMISQPDQVVVVSAINHYIREEETTTTNEEETTTPGESEGGTLPEESTEESSEEETTAPETTSGGNGGGGNGGGNGGGGGGDRSRVVNRPTDVITDDDVPLVNITPEDVPLADMPEETETPLVILDEDVPLVGLAKTGDSSMSVGVLMGMMILSLLAALGVAKRRKEEE